MLRVAGSGWLAVASWLRLAENTAVRERFVAKYAAWRAQLGTTIEGVEQANNIEALGSASQQYGIRRVLCPLNHQGDCSVYAVRPALCRTTHALDSNDKCLTDADTVKTLQHPGVEKMYDGQQGMRSLLHDTLRPNRSPQILAKAVHRLLTQDSVSPNQMCPCGSEKKYKHCCR
jgi:Fe-S-cluster containining protein